MRKADERGIALLLALLVLALLTAIVLEFDAEARREYREAAAFRDHVKSGTLMRAAVQAASAALQQDFLRDKRSGEQFDGPLDLWTIPIKNYAIGDGLLSAQIQDERGKLNLNDLVASAGDPIQSKTRIDRIRRLFELLQINPDLVDALIDWLDQDDAPRPAGAESLHYQSLRPAYRAANGPLQAISDLRLIKGFTPDIINRLSRYVTVYPIDGGAPVNINTAEPPVIQALDPDITPTMAMEIVQGRPYKTKEELNRIGSFVDIGAKLRASGSVYDVKSDYFSARLTITVNESVKNAFVVLHREPDKGHCTVKYLQVF
ncbi:MAG: type II secretion system minor pseudopilin GspK [Nitrospira sp.]|nr:type II secretion system minor pseudopilin GspK [Nitrospira sp.]